MNVYNDLGLTDPCGTLLVAGLQYENNDLPPPFSYLQANVVSNWLTHPGPQEIYAPRQGYNVMLCQTTS